ncbi:hypothetical protein SMXD51_08234 (plasmid) [Ligilactobacillus salivarius SMXD51]|uniref:Uncharacterized protein n=1 Tax=Ligilactobacillus salivarius SMXD51 TaxID=1108963 RepID=H7G1N9_9LACO|nr:hypothetical protein SMXD51_08234 [Ligilactobacillus salivarius SMXD51]
MCITFQKLKFIFCGTNVLQLFFFQFPFLLTKKNWKKKFFSANIKYYKNKKKSLKKLSSSKNIKKIWSSQI